MTTLLSRLVTSWDGEPFALIRRGDSDVVDVLTGPVVDVDSLSDIPLGTGPKAPDVLALVPYRQIRERGFMAHDDGAPLRCMVVAEREAVAVAAALDILPEEDVPVDAADFDITDEDYAGIVRNVISNEIGRGEGANFVIRRSFLGQAKTHPAAAVLRWMRQLLTTESGAYWTFAIHTAGHSLVGATPERHVSVRDGLLTMNPISGTFRHPVDGPTRERVLNFLADAKENDELFMVVDEEMKMMSAVCPSGGRILGPLLKQMSRLSHTEYLLEGKTSMDPREVLRATMFAPTVTGSPIENAAAVIQRYERGGRGYYSGVAALFEASAESPGHYDLDAPILIRTAQLDARGQVSVSAGATIVRNSTPEAEVAETRVKALGMLSALGLVPGRPAPPAPDLNNEDGVAEALAARNGRLAPFWLRPQSQDPAPCFSGRTALVVDAEDQFTQMLAHQLRHLGLQTEVRRWSSLTDVSEPDLVVFGPGPGDPRTQYDPRIKTLQRLIQSRLDSGQALLAVCLSHQILAQLAGLPVDKLPAPRQGTSMEVDIFGVPARLGFYNTFSAMSRPGQGHTPSLGLEISSANGFVNALLGDGIASVQAHLESVLSPDGLQILERLVRRALDTAPSSAGLTVGR